jgi:type I restriction enzyme M protein
MYHFLSLVSLPDSEDRARAIIEAMESIKADYENLRAVLLTRRPINFF